MNSIIHIQASGEAATLLVTEIPHMQHTMYHVIMECGYANVFYTDVETGKWVEEDLGFTDLATQIGKEVRNLKLRSVHVPKILTWHTAFIEDKSIHFGFFSFMHGDNKMFEIYHSNKKYQYTLEEVSHDEWHIIGQNNSRISAADATVIREIIKVLPFYSYSE